MPTTIRKSLISAFGDVSNVNIVTDTIEDPSKNEIQVRVLYSGFSGADINMRLGRYPLQRQPLLTPGYCLVGTVEKQGPECNGKLRAGDVVAALTVYDSEATLANVPEMYLIPVPRDLDLQKACALVLDWTTAYGMVFRSAKVQAGQRVFVHGMSGAVGYATATICQMQGATVYGTASERHHEALKGLGWHPFVYTNKEWMTAMKELGGADAIFDPLGYESWDESYSVLSHDNACLVGYGTNLASMEGQPARGTLFTTIKLLSRNFMCPVVHRHTRFFYITRDDKTFVPELQALFQLLADGKIDVKIKAVFDLEDIQEAHNRWGKSTGFGSALLNVGAK
jgi:NADPH:quinone reductase-like Zn-dependent oxidoreductase